MSYYREKRRLDDDTSHGTKVRNVKMTLKKIRKATASFLKKLSYQRILVYNYYYYLSLKNKGDMYEKKEYLACSGNHSHVIFYN
ncbi:hypothetical protein [Vagococcus elongatus]